MVRFQILEQDSWGAGRYFQALACPRLSISLNGFLYLARNSHIGKQERENCDVKLSFSIHGRFGLRDRGLYLAYVLRLRPFASLSYGLPPSRCFLRPRRPRALYTLALLCFPHKAISHRNPDCFVRPP